MAAAGSDGGRLLVSHAAQVCLCCKARKKKCDKVLPSCGYCIRKSLRCAYSTPHTGIKSRAPLRSQAPPPPPASDTSQYSPSPLVSSQPLALAPAESATSLHVQIHRLIRSTGQFVDDVSARYFQGIHRYLPIVSRTRFHNSLITLGATPSPGFSVLLLAICVVVSSLKVGRARQEVPSTSSLDRRQLYLTAKSLLAQVQASFSVSIHLIQAALLLSLHEYVEGRPDDALATLASCARMAYAARIHVHDSPTFASVLPLTPSTDSGIGTSASDDISGNVDVWLKAEEASNTWWGIIICERKYICEASVSEQPLITIFPGAEARLPIEPEILELNDSSVPDNLPSTPVYSMECSHVKAFGRAAQASWYLDQILKIFQVSNVETRLGQLKTVDIALQNFLGLLMPQCHSGTQVFCEALAIAIRAYWALHFHRINLRLDSDVMPGKPTNIWVACSHTALNTGVKMALDIAEFIDKPETHITHAIAPGYLYNVRAALRYIARHGPLSEEREWLSNAEKRLRQSLEDLS